MLRILSIACATTTQRLLSTRSRDRHIDPPDLEPGDASPTYHSNPSMGSSRESCPSHYPIPSYVISPKPCSYSLHILPLQITRPCGTKRLFPANSVAQLATLICCDLFLSSPHCFAEMIFDQSFSIFRSFITDKIADWHFARFPIYCDVKFPVCRLSRRQ